MKKKEAISIFREMMNGIVDLDKVVPYLDSIGYFTAPASTKYHLSHEGGLFEHSVHVTEELVRLTDALGLKWENEKSPWIIGMFHDLCKCDNYIFTDFGYEYNKNTILTGHGNKSVMIASTILPLTMEEVMCITFHMGAFTEKEEWSHYTEAIHKYPNVLWTHTADMVAAHIMEEKV